MTECALPTAGHGSRIEARFTALRERGRAR